MKEEKLIGVQRAVIADKDLKILIVRNVGNDFWHYPGGKWESGKESIIEGLAREVNEEVGITGLTYSFLAIQELRRPSKTYIETYWSARIDKSARDIHLNIQDEEVEEAQWVDRDQLEKYGVMPMEINKLLTILDNTQRYIGTIYKAI